MPGLRLKTVTRTQGNNAAITSGAIRPDGIDLEFEDVPVLVHAFRRMVREHAYDVCEMALTTYLCAKEHGARFTALPIFLVRGLHHDKIVRHRDAGVDAPADLEGRPVGVHRGYTVTTGVWARGILRDEYGVDLDRVTWMRTGDEHVAGYEPPPNVVSAPADRGLAELLAAGDIAAAVNLDTDDPALTSLIPDAEDAALRSLRASGVYPINHLVVVRDEVLDAHPEVAPALFEAFVAAKDRYVDALRGGDVAAPTASDRLHRRVMETIDGDPLPYGIEPNRHTLETLVRHAVDQRILARPVDVATMFVPATRDLVA